MPRAANAEQRRVRNADMRANRARGWTVRKLALWYALAPASVHRIVADVRIELPARWHRARLPQEAPLPALAVAHRVLAPNWPSR